MPNGLVGQDQITTFTSPVNGTSPIDANVVRGNDNTLKTAFNLHDNDPTIHFQSSPAVARPPAGIPGRKWLDSDTYRVYYDDGAAWHEIAYLASAGGSTSGPITVNGALVVHGPVQLDGVPVIIGVDPGGAQILRVGGGVHASGPVQFDATLAVTGFATFGTSIAGYNLIVNAVAAVGAAEIDFQASGATKWQIGRGVADGSNDFIIYNSLVGLAARIAAATNALTVSEIGVVPNASATQAQRSMFSTAAYGLAFRAGAGTTWDFLLLNAANSGFVLGVPPGSTTLSLGGFLMATQGLSVTGTTTIGTPGTIYGSAAQGLIVFGGAGTVNDYLLTNKNGSTVMNIPTGTQNAIFAQGVLAAGQISGASFISPGPYTFLKAPDAVDGIIIGGAGDQQMYFNSGQFNFRNRAASALFAAVSDTAAAGDTALTVKCQDTGSALRIKTGAAGTGPGGVGRALYV